MPQARRPDLPALRGSRAVIEKDPFPSTAGQPAPSRAKGQGRGVMRFSELDPLTPKPTAPQAGLAPEGIEAKRPLNRSLAFKTSAEAALESGLGRINQLRSGLKIGARSILVHSSRATSLTVGSHCPAGRHSETKAMVARIG